MVRYRKWVSWETLPAIAAWWECLWESLWTTRVVGLRASAIYSLFVHVGELKMGMGGGEVADLGFESVLEGCL